MKFEASDSPRPEKKRARSGSSLILKVFVAAVVLAAYSGALFVFGMLAYRGIQSAGSPGGPRTSFRAVPQRIVAVAKNHVASLRQDESLELLHLDIKFKHLEKLRDKRQEALDKGVLMAEDDDFVPATIRHDGRSIKTKIRLKGDMLDHLRGDKWSFRVKVRGGDQLFGMRRFSLQAPAVRDHQSEPIFLAHLRREGILTPHFRFVEVSVNGKGIGVMAIEEHFSKELLESQRRREGVILRFDENPFWENLSLNGTFGPYSNPHIATLTPFRSSKVAESAALSSDFATAVGLMRGFMEGRLPPEDVFEVELMARFMAVAEVWRTHHPLAWHNIRFYFNPLTSRMEPVGFDGNVQAIIHEPGLVTTHGGFTPMLLANDDFKAVFIRELGRIAGEMADGSVAEWARPMEDKLVPQLQEGFERIEPMRFEALMHRAQSLALINSENFGHYLPPLGDPDMRYPEPVKVYLCSNCPTPQVEILNALPVPVSILSLEVTPRSDTPASVAAPIARSEFPLELPATTFMEAATPAVIEFDAAENLDRFKVEVVAQASGQATRHTVRADDYYATLSASPLPESSLEDTLAQHPFLRSAADGMSLSVEPGTWDVAAPIVIPPGLGLTMSAGTELRFPEGGILVSSGPLRFEGTAEAPIKLGPAPGHETWGGLVSLRTDTPHIWKHVIVSSTSGFQRVGWRLTGGVTLRAAEVQISDSQFLGNRGEDALNLIRSEFELDRVDFRDTHSDALDADFSNGVIRGGRYSEIGGDGIDVSGARIEVDGTTLVDINDKAISVGEASRLSARNVRIERVGTGAASKDASELTFEDSSVTDASTAGVSVYTKKPVYGPAKATVARVEMKNVATEALVQSGNQALIDGVAAPQEPFDTDILY